MSFKDVDFHQLSGCVLDLRPETGIRDRSGYENHGTYEGGMGVVGGEFVFDGVDDYINAGDVTQLPNAFTLAANVTPSGVTSGYGSVIIRDLFGDPYQFYGLFVGSGGTLSAAVSTGGVRTLINQFAAGLVDNTTYHLAATYDGEELAIWVDGVKITSTAVSGTIDVQANNCTVGGSSIIPSSDFKGTIANAQIYNRALSATEVAFLAKQPLEPFGLLGGETLCLQPQRYSGTGDLLDESGNGNALPLSSTIAAMDDLIRITGAGHTFSGVSMANSPGTLSCWVKTTDTQFVLFSDSGSGFVGAVFDNSQSHTSSVTSPITYVDGQVLVGDRAALLAAIADGEWHLFTVTADFAASWTTVKLCNFGASWEILGDLADVRIYPSRKLADTEVKTLYNNGVPGYERPRTRRQYSGCVLDYRPVTGVRDRSYALNHGTYEGEAYSNGREFVFDGADSYVKHSGQLSGVFEGNWTWNIVFTPNALGFHVLSASDETVTTRYVSLLMNGTLQVNVSGPVEGTLIATGSTSLIANTEYRVSVVMGDSGLSVYVGGIEETLTITSGTNEKKTFANGQISNQVVGAIVRTSPANFSNISVRKVQIFNTALTAGQIANLASDPDFEPFGNLGGEVLSIQPQRYKGSGDLIDESGNGNDGTLVSGVTVSESSIDFVGGHSGINLGNLTSATSAESFTLSAWITANNVTDSQIVFGKDVAEHRDYTLMIGNTPGTLAWYNGSTISESGACLSDGTLHHIVVVKMETLITLYCDGISVKTATDTRDHTKPNDLYLGLREYAGFAFRFVGQMEDIRIIDRSLTLAEVKYLYNNGTPGVEVPNSRGAVAAYSPSYDEAGNGSTTLLDYSGGANHGTLTNMDPATDWVDDTDEGGIRELTLNSNPEHVLLPPYQTESIKRSFAVSFKPTTANRFSYLFFQDGSIGFGTSSAGRLQLVVASSVNYAWSFSNTQGAGILTDGTWHTVVVLQTLEGISWYLDGEYDGEDTLYTGGANQDNSNILLGLRSGSSGLRGGLDDWLAFDRVLSQSEIQVLSQSRNVFGNPVQDLVNIIFSKQRSSDNIVGYL